MNVNNIVSTTIQTVEKLKGYNNWWNALFLYFDYIKHSRIQWTNQVWCNDEFMIKSIWYWVDKFRWAKNILKELWLIEVIQTRDQRGKLWKYYIKINFLISEDKREKSILPDTGKTRDWLKPEIGKTTSNALSNINKMLKEKKENTYTSFLVDINNKDDSNLNTFNIVDINKEAVTNWNETKIVDINNKDVSNLNTFVLVDKEKENKNKEISSDIQKIFEFWNAQKELDKHWKGVRKINTDLSKIINKILKDYEKEDIQHALDWYKKEIKGRQQDWKWYDTHRFTIDEFFTRKWWFKKFVNII